MITHRQEPPLQSRDRAPRAEGFTLIEIMLALSILVILAMVTLGYFRGINEDANFQQCQANIVLINQAMERYKSEAMFYPETLQQILYVEYGLPELPRCPGSGDHPAQGDYGLAVPEADLEGYDYIIYCTDERHKGKAPAGFPQYTSIPNHHGNRFLTGTND
jgi:prepilin-type N-terminal cleavage/methylation domain-containing protein